MLMEEGYKETPPKSELPELDTMNHQEKNIQVRAQKSHPILSQHPSFRQLWPRFNKVC